MLNQLTESGESRKSWESQFSSSIITTLYNNNYYYINYHNYKLIPVRWTVTVMLCRLQPN